LASSATKSRGGARGLVAGVSRGVQGPVALRSNLTLPDSDARSVVPAHSDTALNHPQAEPCANLALCRTLQPLDDYSEPKFGLDIESSRQQESSQTLLHAIGAFFDRLFGFEKGLPEGCLKPIQHLLSEAVWVVHETQAEVLLGTEAETHQKRIYRLADRLDVDPLTAQYLLKRMQQHGITNFDGEIISERRAEAFLYADALRLVKEARRGSPTLFREELQISSETADYLLRFFRKQGVLHESGRLHDADGRTIRPRCDCCPMWRCWVPRVIEWPV
jgi:hypothetical protein